MLGELVIETCSVAMRLGMADIWTWLRGEGLRLAVCSNLSSDHVAALRDTLPGQPEVLSCKVGAIKPEPAIYARVDGLQIKVDKVLFVGDTPRADIEGSQAAVIHHPHAQPCGARDWRRGES